jgi:hypothetical protein
MASRFVGLIVVPGKHIVKLEVEMKQVKPWEGAMALRGGKAGQAASATQSKLAETHPQEEKTT